MKSTKMKIGTPRGRGIAKLGPRRGNVNQHGTKTNLKVYDKVKKK